MVRENVQLQRIEDKSRRQVCFSKRESGLLKKAKELSVLCDVEMAMIMFSATGKLYEFCSGGHSRSITLNIRVLDGNRLQMVQRFSEGKNIKQLNKTQLVQLEKELDSVLIQTRLRKTEAMMKSVTSLHQKEKYLTDENNLIIAREHDHVAQDLDCVRPLPLDLFHF